MTVEYKYYHLNNPLVAKYLVTYLVAVCYYYLVIPIEAQNMYQMVPYIR